MSLNDDWTKKRRRTQIQTSPRRGVVDVEAETKRRTRRRKFKPFLPSIVTGHARSFARKADG